MSTETKNVRTCTSLLSSVAACECEMAFSIFANGKDPLSSVSTAISNKEDSFESANEHWSRFAAVCNLKSRNAENISLTLTAYEMFVFGAVQKCANLADLENAVE